MNAAPTLFEQQIALQHWLMRGDHAISALIDGDRRMDRLRIYADAYRLRLADVLRNDFPVLHAVVGGDRFNALAAGYLSAHPSQHPSVRHFGHAFPQWLAGRKDTIPLASLAAFEWAQGEAFDAPDAPTLVLDALATLPASDWPGLRLQLHPAMRFVRAPAGIPAMIETHGAERRPRQSMRGTPVDWLLWRRDYTVHWRRLDGDEATLLRAVRDGATFSALCAELATAVPEADAALRAAGLLKRWVIDGLVVAAIAPPDPTT